MEIQASSDPTIIETKECEVCELVDWKYTCPRCLIHTCSLNCVVQHKKEKQCSGERDKTAYVSLKEYNESNMMSDYTYLEDLSRKSDNISRTKPNATVHQKAKHKHVSKQANYLGILYHSLPEGMSRQKHNQTNYNLRSKQIHWTIETVYFSKSNKKNTYLEHGFPGSKPCNDFFQNILYSDAPLGRDSHSITRHELKDFVESNLSQFKVALKKEKSPRGHFVDITQVMDMPFVDILRGENIVEYPTIYIWLKDHPQPIDIVSLEEKKMLIRPIKEEDIKEETEIKSDEEEQIF